VPADFPYERHVDAAEQERYRRAGRSAGQPERLRQLLARGSELASDAHAPPGRPVQSGSAWLDRRHLSEDHERLSPWVPANERELKSGAHLGEVTGGWVCLARNLETGPRELVLALEYAGRAEVA